MKTNKKGRPKKMGRPRQFQRQQGGGLVEQKTYHDRRTGRKLRKEQHLDEADDRVDDSDPGGEGVNVVDG